MTTQSNETNLKIGILSFAHGHAGSYASEIVQRPGVTLAGVWDADAERGQACAKQFGTTFYASEAELLALGLDGVVVASENTHHRRLVELAADSGVKAVVSEKPLATTVEDARAMIDYCAARNVKLATAFPCRHSPAFKRLREQIQSGAVGEILAIRGTNRGTMPGGWFIDLPLSGGGAVIDHTVHVADLIWLLLGKNATEVYAEIGNGFYHQEYDDTGFLTISYDGGVFATLDTSWSRPKTFPTWGDVTLQVVGTGGVFELDLFGQQLEQYDDAAGRVLWPNWGSSLDGELVDGFLKLSAGEEAPDTATGEDGLRALEIALAAYKSAEAKQPAAV
ncbi:dehydrogenase [Capsulimonas corticalis]|uniref:Dehydrogenase n=1 Tax=Capsulimonas corticalis TaxID=2219043 RepID=A0A402CUI3_9BACT|nr:Gfo/Idh/MocA family oxidoreductase [Capsulimonas corticalis]BDI29013.1 dehydrogenase [Capsulimonas corticalis]